MLGAPPAFVLSQDQTLDKLVILNLSIEYTLSKLVIALTFQCFRIDSLTKFSFPNLCHKKLIVFTGYHLCYPADKNSALFIFQCTIRHPSDAPPPPSATAFLVYHFLHTLSSSFLKVFLKNFTKNKQRGMVYS